MGNLCAAPREKSAQCQPRPERRPLPMTTGLLFFAHNAANDAEERQNDRVLHKIYPVQPQSKKHIPPHGLF